METLTKFAALLAVGSVIFTANLWYIRALISSISNTEIVIAPIKVLGANKDQVDLDENLSRMLVARMRLIEWNVERSQTELQSEPSASSHAKPARQESAAPEAGAGTAEERPAVIGIVGFLGSPSTVGLNATLFEPTSIEAKVGGVDVGGLLPRIQRWFVQDKILALSVSYVDPKAAIVTGNTDILRSGARRPLWLKIADATPEYIADEVAHELIRRKWSAGNSFYDDLEPTQFKILVTSVIDVASINRRVVKYGVPHKGDYARVLKELSPLADELANWGDFGYFAASVAESAEAYDRAIELLERVNSLDISADLASRIEAKIASLEELVSGPSGEPDRQSFEKIRKDAEFATTTLNELFGMNRPSPPVKSPERNMRNAYWDGTSIFIPAALEAIPDITYHEAAWPFVQQRWKFNYEGESGALAQSYTDVLASFIKQRNLYQDAETADWVLGRGAIAWLKGKSEEIKTDKRPLQSFEAPGTAYDDQEIGKDPQIAHLRYITRSNKDISVVHSYAGVSNKAFYETARRIGTDVAVGIWIDSLNKYEATTDFRGAAKIMIEVAGAKYGKNSKEAKAVKEAWSTVGYKS